MRVPTLLANRFVQHSVSKFLILIVIWQKKTEKSVSAGYGTIVRKLNRHRRSDQAYKRLRPRDLEKLHSLLRCLHCHCCVVLLSVPSVHAPDSGQSAAAGACRHDWIGTTPSYSGLLSWKPAKSTLNTRLQRVEISDF
jgi:hypothetical protein